MRVTGLALALPALLGAAAAYAQTPMGITQGQNWSPAQWNNWSTSKQDYPVPLATTGAAGTIKPDGTTLVLGGAGLLSVSGIINRNSSTLPPLLTGSVTQIGSLNGVITRAEAISFAAPSFFTIRRAGGSVAVPAALQSGDEIGGFNSWGYDGTVWGGPAAAWRNFAAGTWTLSSHPTELRLSTTPAGSTTLVDRWHVAPDGGLYADGVAGGSKGAGTINAGGYYIGGALQAAFGSVTAPLALSAGALSLNFDGTLRNNAGSLGVGLNAIGNANLSTMAVSGFKGQNAGGGAVLDLTVPQATANLNPCTATLQGMVPTPPNNTTTFLRGDCTFAVPAATAALAHLTATAITNPTGTSSASQVMMGMGTTAKLTPGLTGVVDVTISGTMKNGLANGEAIAHLRYGTGTAPANAAAVTGTLVPGEFAWFSPAANDLTPYTFHAIITGLTVSTAYWFDIDLSASAGSTSTVQNNQASISELY